MPFNLNLPTILLWLTVLLFALFLLIPRKYSVPKVLFLSLGVISFYTYFANSIPQIESRPPAEIEISGAMTPAELAQVGRQIVETKGGCLVCHGIGSPGPRAPDLSGVGARAATRIPGRSAEEYLFESLLDPCAYVVEGYECIMPVVNKPPVSLTDGEVAAVVAYLQSLGGEITVRPPTEGVALEETPAPTGPRLATATTAEGLITELGCGVCHVIPGVEGATGQVGPDLTGLGARADAEYVRQSILDPDAVIAATCPAGPCPAGVMPKDFGARMTAQQLEMLVQFLSGLGSE
jgi:mono/diheme cytochrome c family protein